MGVQIKSITLEATWHLRRNVMWPNKPLDYIKLPKDHKGLHFGLFLDEELVTVASLFIIDDVAQFRKLATKTTEQGNGYGSKMVAHILEEAERNSVKKIWCNARQEKAGFYLRFGLTETARMFSKDNIDYVIMEKALP